MRIANRQVLQGVGTIDACLTADKHYLVDVETSIRRPLMRLQGGGTSG